MLAVYRLALQSGIGHGLMLLMAVLAVASSFTAVLPPQFLGAIVNSVADGVQVYSPFSVLNRVMEAAISLLHHPVATFSVLFLVSSCLAVIVRNLFVLLVSVNSVRFVMHTRNACLAAVTGSRKSDLSVYASGDVVHRVMMDTTQLHYLVGTPLYVLLSDVFDLMWVAFFIALLDWKILAILASVFPMLYLLGRRTGHKRRAVAKKSQEAEAECTGYVQRVLTGLDTIKVYGAEAHERYGFSRLLENIFSFEKRSSLSLGAFFCLEGALRGGGTIAAIAYAAGMALENPVYAGSIPVLILYSQKFYAPLGNWARFYQVIQKSIVSFRRICELLDLPAEQSNGKEAPCAPLQPLQKNSTSDVVHESLYDKMTGSIFPLIIKGNLCVDDTRRLSVDVRLNNPGLVVLRGRSGVGKTQFAKSLISLGPVLEGEIRFGDQRMDCNDMLTARSLFAYASQDGHLIPGTVAQNIAYPEEDRQIDRRKCSDLLEALGMKGFTLDDQVEEYGNNLSLGEGRRLMLGRALYSQRPILLLDEIDANVDPDTRKKLYALIEHEKNRRAIIMITHVNSVELRHIEHTCIVLHDEGERLASPEWIHSVRRTELAESNYG